MTFEPLFKLVKINEKINYYVIDACHIAPYKSVSSYLTHIHTVDYILFTFYITF